MQAPAEEIIKPVRWLLGKWKSVKAIGKYPTIKTIPYRDEIEFKWIGQPTLNYTSFSQHPMKDIPLHLESGFLRIKPGTNQVALLLSHNFGITTVEEGSVNEETHTMELKTTGISRMDFATPPTVTELTRIYKFSSDTEELEQIVCMATTNTPLTEHLRVTYTKCE